MREIENHIGQTTQLFRYRSDSMMEAETVSENLCLIQDICKVSKYFLPGAYSITEGKGEDIQCRNPEYTTFKSESS